VNKLMNSKLIIIFNVYRYPRYTAIYTHYTHFRMHNQFYVAEHYATAKMLGGIKTSKTSMLKFNIEV